MMLPLDLPGMYAIFGLLKEAKALPPPSKTTAVPCAGCIKTFPNKGALARHYQANPLHDVRPTAARPYQCETCKRTFPDQGSLAKHVVRFHSAWPRPNQAAIEDKSVPASTQLPTRVGGARSDGAPSPGTVYRHSRWLSD